jgi:hypothetical protein
MNQTEITFNTNDSNINKNNATPKNGGELKKLYSRLFKLINNFKLLYPESIP